MTSLAVGTIPSGETGKLNRQATTATASSTGSDEEWDSTGRSDGELIAEATRRCEDDRLISGLQIFRCVEDSSLLSEENKTFIHKGEQLEQIHTDLLAPVEEGWTKQGESHGKRDFITYYKIEDGRKLYCRIESVIEASLYVPLLSVLNETDLYETWFPKWSFPFKVGINRSKMLKQAGRIEQVVQLTVDLPFPLSKRECIFHGFAEDGTADSQTASVKLLTVDESFDGGNVVPPPEKGITRIEIESDFLFRACPEDHEVLKKSKGKYPDDEKKILATFVIYVDPKIAFIPHAFMNFCTRTVIGTVWKMLLSIASQVREGTRVAHAERIKEKSSLYEWLKERAALMTGLCPTSENADN